MDIRQFGFGEIVAEAIELLRRNATPAVLAVLAIAAGYSLLDIAGASAANAISTIAVSVFGQYHFTELLLPGRIPPGPPKRRYGSLLLASILSGMGVVTGLVFLVLPGLFLLARWAIATPFIVCDGMTGTESLGASWQATAKSWPAVAGVMAIYGLALVVTVVVLVVLAERTGLAEDSMVLLIPTNLVTGALSVGA